MNAKRTGERIYLDHAATTPVRAEVLEAMLPHLRAGYNPSSTHREGRAARAVLDEARERVATVLGVRASEVVFTAGGTESDNLAIAGAAHALRERGRHVITTASEHHAVLRACDSLRDEGWEVTLLRVASDGAVDPDEFEAAIRPDTTLASVMLANNEIGTLGPVAELAAIASSRRVIFHTDAIQAPGNIPIGCPNLGVDLLSLSAHKFYGPKGVGALYIRGGTPLAPTLVGGSQELARRAGTENVAGIVGLAAALELAEGERPQTAPRVAALRDRFEAGIAAALDDISFNGRREQRLPNISNVAFGGLDADTLLIRLDLDGIAASAGSACAAGAREASHVISAIGLPERLGRGAVRFSLGRSTTVEEIDATVERVCQIVPSLRKFSRANA